MCYMYSMPLRLLQGIALLLIVCASAVAQNRRIDQLYHTAWTIKDGAPGQISTIAQSTEGYLWLSAAAGLYRFDGVTFERIAVEPNDPDLPGTVRSLFAPKDGGLWVGFSFGGVSFWKDGKIRSYTAADGIPEGGVLSIEADADGAIWIATGTGLARFDGSRWTVIGEDWNFPSGAARYVYFDREHRLWAATADSLFYLPPRERKFRATGLRVKWIGEMAQDAGGRLWVAESSGFVHPLERTVDAAGVERWSFGQPQVQTNSAGMLFDSEGALWINTLGDGMRRLSLADQRRTQPITIDDDSIESFTHINGLTANYVWPILKDREGNIWTGTSAGLDRFRVSPFAKSHFPPGAHDFALVADKSGAIWAGTTNRELMRLSGTTLTRFPQVPPFVTCAYREPDGSLMFGARHGLWQARDNKVTKLTDLPGNTVDRSVQAMVRDPSGALWVSFKSPQGLAKFANGQWSTVALAEAPEKISPNVMIADASGALWLGYNGNVVLRVDGDRVQAFTAADELSVGNVFSLHQSRDVLWVGGVRGLAYFDGRKFHSLHLEEGTPLQNVTAIMETADASLWLHAVPGVFSLPAAEVQRAREDPTYRVRYRTFDFLDGLPGRPTLSFPQPTAIAGAGGRLWFATSDGVAWIDPGQIGFNPIAPWVTIRALRANGVSYPVGPNLTLPKRTDSLQIDYAALSLSVPQRIRYRYKLDGLDRDWQDPGQRREAIYTNLDPGQYRFRVIAANNDGVWNESGATLDFYIAPAFTQTYWFIALCVLAVGTLLFVTYLIRMRNVATRIKGRLEERISERERIARELHDTLLQGVQGVILRFQAAVDRIPEGEPARHALSKALDRADDVLVEGRDRVNDLRSTAAPAVDLPTVVEQAGEEFARDYPAQFQLTVTGTPQALHPVVRDEVYAIVREALANAFRHAQASNIEVEIVYDRRELRLHVRDDGRGIDGPILAAGRRREHWGLIGMRERARQIRAHFQLWSRPGAGAEIELRIPAVLAYRTRAREPRWRRWLAIEPDAEAETGDTQS
jgi:signal transduction histidine kinase/ligand-binding sensor domain-containing protein